MAKAKDKNQKDLELAQLVEDAKNERTKNKDLIRDLRQDPGMADDVKALMSADLVRVSEIPRMILGTSSSRDRYRQFGHYSTSLADFLFGVWAEFQRQAGLGQTLQTKKVLRNISKTSRAQLEADYADQHVRPWDGAYNRLNTDKKRIRLLIGSDFHSHFCNPFALRVWNDLIKMKKPDGIRINGDLVDFPSLSTHRNFPGHFPLSVQEEIDWAVEKVLRPARKNAPKADIKFLVGNHDVRLVTAMADKGPMFASLRSNSFAEQFKLDELKVGLVCRSNFLNLTAKQRRVDVAQNWETLYSKDGRPLWTTVHGFLCGKDSARKHVKRFMTHGTNGHLHDRQLLSEGSMSTGVVHWWQTPCMAHPAAVAAGYIHGPVEASGWSCGMLLVDIYPETGYVSGQFIEVGDDMACLPGEDKVWTIKQHERDAIAAMLTI